MKVLIQNAALLFLPFILLSLVFGDAADRPFEPVRQRSHVEKIRSGRLAYALSVDGTADMDNTMTRTYKTFEIAFQNNISLTIANTGTVTVKNPRVVTNGMRRWWSIEALLHEILDGARDDQEKAYLIYDFVRTHRHHDDPIFRKDELHDPVKMLNVFGAGLCDDSGYVGCSLFYHAGLNKEAFGQNPSVRTLHGHMMCEAILSTGRQFLDIDENTFYLDLENERPVSGDAVGRDHYLAKREHAYGPIFQDVNVGERAASLFGRDDGATFRAVAGHRIEVDLRPGERIVYRWDDCGKFPSDDTQGACGRRFWANSLWVYEPVLTRERINVDTKNAADADLVYEMTTPYAVCGGRVAAAFVGKTRADRFRVSISLDGRSWTNVWERSGAGNVKCNVDIDNTLEIKKPPAKYTYFVRITSNQESVQSLRIETDLMASPHALPRLGLGRNSVEYADETVAPHEVTVTHRWRESDRVKPPKAPEQPITPTHDTTVRATTVPFRWQAGPDASRYHIRVSRRPDMRLAYRPCFDVVVSAADHHWPFAGLFSPDEQYYWQVRPCNRAGVWGRWSPVWRFKWDGPRIPVDLESSIEDRIITISWKRNPRGKQPVQYEVYGSNERGFTPSKEPYEVQGLGSQPGNLLQSTAGTEIRVVAHDADQTAMNCAFYRVVAIDENNVASGPSNLLELPHPFIYSKPITGAAVGVSYRYHVKTLRCLGDLQHRYATPHLAFWEEEGYEFELTDHAAWLSIDKETGILAGTPGTQDVGTHRVTVLCHRRFPRELKKGDYRPTYFQKDDPRFHASDEQTFNVCVR